MLSSCFDIWLDNTSSLPNIYLLPSFLLYPETPSSREKAEARNSIAKIPRSGSPSWAGALCAGFHRSGLFSTFCPKFRRRVGGVAGRDSARPAAAPEYPARSRDASARTAAYDQEEKKTVEAEPRRQARRAARRPRPKVCRVTRRPSATRLEANSCCTSLMTVPTRPHPRDSCGLAPASRGKNVGQTAGVVTVAKSLAGL